MSSHLFLCIGLLHACLVAAKPHGPCPWLLWQLGQPVSCKAVLGTSTMHEQPPFCALVCCFLGSSKPPGLEHTLKHQELHVRKKMLCFAMIINAC
jgi:hypothetical protein